EKEVFRRPTKIAEEKSKPDNDEAENEKDEIKGIRIEEAECKAFEYFQGAAENKDPCVQ
ncbi:9325_t:CDS:2, partial [Cetraspora pellucida]